MEALLRDFGPLVALTDAAYIDPSASIHGRVTAAEGASIWPHVSIRAENFEVVIGAYSNIQDFAMLHVGATAGVRIGRHCSITHRCTIHGATIGDNCLIGINSTVMDGATVGDNCLIGAHTLIRENQVIPANSVAFGVPAKVTKRRNNYAQCRLNAFFYHQNGLAYAAGNQRRWDEPEFMKLAAEAMQRFQAEAAEMAPATE